MKSRRTKSARGATAPRNDGARRGRHLWGPGGGRLFDADGQELALEYIRLSTVDVEEGLAQRPAMVVGVIECGAGVTFFRGSAAVAVWQERIRGQFCDPTSAAPDPGWGYVVQEWRGSRTGSPALVFRNDWRDRAVHAP